MLKSSEKLQKLLTVLITWAVLLACFVAYQQYFVKRQESFFRQRGFRALSRLSAELTLKFEEAQISTESFVRLVASTNRVAEPKQESVALNYLEVYLKDVPSKKESVEAAKECRTQSSDHVPLQSMQDRDGLTLSIACFTDPAQAHRDNPDISKIKLLYTLDLEPRIRSGFQQQGSDFDDVLVADSNGHVVFQESAVGPRIADLKSMVTDKEGEQTSKSASSSAESGQDNEVKKGGDKDAKKGKPSGPKTSVPGREASLPETRGLNKLNDTSTFTDVTLAGEPYKMFSQPVQISLHSDLPGKPPLNLVLVGLRHVSKFISETHALPYSTLIWAALIVLSLFSLSWPLFKLRYMSATERFTPKDGWLLIIAIFLAATSVTLILLNASYLAQAKRGTDRHLQALADNIKENFEDEMKASLRQLQKLSNEALPVGPKETILTPNYLMSEKRVSELLADYPFFEIAAWMNNEGQQVAKFDVRRGPTPAINLKGQDFFEKVRSSGNDESETPSQPGGVSASGANETQNSGDLLQHAYFQPLFSPSTDEFIAVLSDHVSTKLQKEHANVAVQALTSRPMSLVDPVVPPGYGFAIIDSACKVLFHSDSIRDGKENFCEESKTTAELRPWLFSGADNFLDVSYAGHSEHAFLTAIKFPGNSSAFLIVFQEPDRQVTLNLAIILVCSILLAAYVAILLLAAVVHLAVRRRFHWLYAPHFIWPCRQQALNYLQLSLATGAMLLLFWLIYPSLYEAPLLALTLAVPLLSVLFAISKLNNRTGILSFLAWVLFAGGTAGLILSCSPTSKSLQGWCGLFVFLALCGALAQLLSGKPSLIKNLVTRVLKIPARAASSAQNYFTRLYVVAVVSLVVSAALVPSLGFFKYAYDVVGELSLKRDQAVISDRVLARFDRIHDYYEEVNAPPEIKAKRIRANWDRYDKYDGIFTETCEPHLLQQKPANTQTVEPACPDIKPSPVGFNERIEKLIAAATLLFPSNQLGSEMSELGVAGNDFLGERKTWDRSWSEDPSDPRAFTLTWKLSSRMPGYGVKSLYMPWEGLRWWAKGCLISLWAILGLWLITVVKKIFFTEFEGVLAHDEVQWKSIGDIKKSALIVGPAKSGKTRWLRTILVPPLDAQARAAGASASSSSTTSSTTAVSSSTGVEWLDMRSNQAQMTCPNH
ncbi:MAG TPA: hypothetical protein VG649_07080, partial [Candidatus Angelobacter sp.]|nr:hypothetical protein [Candidatus Angelobacter sp.]